MKNLIPIIEPQIFWDTDPSKLDYDKNDRWIIERVFERGSWENVLEIIVYYGREKVKTTLLSAISLHEHSIKLACSIFKVNPIDFKCYGRKQFRPTF